MTDIAITVIDEVINLTAINQSAVAVVLEPQITKIETSPQGIAGLSAYAVAVKNGFIGTEQQWLNSLSSANTSAISSIIIAAKAIGGNRAVLANGDYADNTNLLTANLMVGITKNAAVLGESLEIISCGELDGFSGLMINFPLFLSINGTITQIAPTTGYIQKIGVALSNTKALIQLSTAIITA